MDNKTVLKALGVGIIKNMPTSKDVEVVGIVNGFIVYPYSYYWVVRGKMPLTYADELYKFRDLEIRAAGGHRDSVPTECCSSDELEKYEEEQMKLFDLVGLSEYVNNVKNKRKKLMEEDINSFYVETYHVDTLEGLKKVVDTIKKYNIKTEW